MKKAVSVSLGSSQRDKVVTIRLGDEDVCLERIGMDGDLEAAAQKLKELDENPDVHALGVGGANLGTYMDDQYYEYKCIQPMVRFVTKTPLVDGSGLKNTLEADIATFIDGELGSYIEQHGGRKVFVVCGVERWELSMSFVNAGYEYVFGDMMFALGIPIPIRRLGVAKMLAKILVPITTRLFPFDWLYPTGDKQNERTPKYIQYYEWATVIAGDCHYIKQHMPDNLQGKVVVTNTTTLQDVQDFRQAGVKYLVTTTPVLDGRSFGTNLMEAALVAVSGKGRALKWDELREMLEVLGLKPHVQTLN
jgi:hypothetical protein